MDSDFSTVSNVDENPTATRVERFPSLATCTSEGVELVLWKESRRNAYLFLQEVWKHLGHARFLRLLSEASSCSVPSQRLGTIPSRPAHDGSNAKRAPGSDSSPRSSKDEAERMPRGEARSRSTTYDSFPKRVARAFDALLPRRSKERKERRRTSSRRRRAPPDVARRRDVPFSLLIETHLAYARFGIDEEANENSLFLVSKDSSSERSSNWLRFPLFFSREKEKGTKADGFLFDILFDALLLVETKRATNVVVERRNDSRFERGVKEVAPWNVARTLVRW